MNDTNQHSAEPRLSDYPRKVAFLLLLVVNTAIGFYFFFNLRPDTHPLVRHFLADMTVGLVAGFGTRGLLGKRNWFIRVVTATASMIIALVFLGIMSNWRTGLGPLSFWRETIDWGGMAQVLTGLTGIFLAMRAWTKTGEPLQSMTVPSEPSQAIATAPLPKAGTVTTGLAKEKPKRKRKRTTGSKATQPATASAIMRNSPTQTGSQAAVRTITSKETAKTELPAGSINNKKQGKAQPQFVLQKPHVRLSKIENHLCPYCLEPVLRKDPRGVVECEICHTQHHGDCWAIAGFCQVPHYTA